MKRTSTVIASVSEAIHFNVVDFDGLPRRLCLLAMTTFFLVFASSTFAVMPDERLADPALEARARSISQELRCLVCQNQSIDDSDATIAKDLRLLVRERLSKGESDATVKAYIRDRYGDFVLLKPPFNLTTFLLWLLPFLILATALFFIVKRYRENPYKEESDV